MLFKNATKKQKIVLVLGILYILFHIIQDIWIYGLNPELLYILSTSTQYASMAFAMIFANFRKKKPAVILVSIALALCFVNQYAITYGTVDPFFRTLYYMIEYILLFAYALADDRKRDRLIWVFLFIFAVGYSVWEVLRYYNDMKIIFIALYLGFYIAGYAPEKWYKTKLTKIVNFRALRDLYRTGKNKRKEKQAIRKEKRETRKETRQEKREDRREKRTKRKEIRAAKKEKRQEKKVNRKENRHEIRAAKKEKRQEKRANRKVKRQENRANRKEKRQEKRTARKEKRQEKRGKQKRQRTQRRQRGK